MKAFHKILVICCALCLFVNTTCDDDDTEIIIDTNCDFITTIDSDLFDSIDNEVFFGIEAANIVEDCLELTISSSGCDGQSWEFELVDSGAIAESSPVQRYLRLKFTNLESCLAVFSRTVSFDLNNLQVENESEIILNIEGVETVLTYQY